jgi:lipopolysaccharide/colanic/teichoic acid biosynthesis glycosyltransferase
MSRGNTSRRSGALAIFEFLLLIACYVLPAYIWLGDSASTYLFYDSGMNADVFTAGCLIALMYFQGLYGAHQRVGMDMVLRLTTAMGVGFLLEGAIFFVQKSLVLPLNLMLGGSGLGFVVLLVGRLIYAGLQGRWLGPERILLVGATPVNRKLAEHLRTHPGSDFSVVGFLDNVLEPGTEVAGCKVLGPLSALPEIRRHVTFHRILVDVYRDELPLPLMDGAGTGDRMERPDELYELLFSQVCSLGRARLLFDTDLAPPRFRLVLQSLYTNLFALGALMFAGPAILVLALLIRIRSGGPAFETQTATGWNLTPFTRFRFRCHRIAKTEAGERRELTEIGRWVERFGLRGLPQMINVLRGEMALVGPSPMRAECAAAVMEVLPYYRLAHLVRPGLVSWSHLNGAGVDVVTALECDLHYMKSLSPIRDLSILCQALSQPRSQQEPEKVGG